MKCPACKKYNKDTAKFCVFCGQPLTASVSETSNVDNTGNATTSTTSDKDKQLGNILLIVCIAALCGIGLLAYGMSHFDTANREPLYSNEEVIGYVFDIFSDDIGSYYSGVDRMYTSTSYSDAYVEFDGRSRTYTCTMIGEFTSNIFDIWGTSTQTYFVYAELRETDDGLKLTYFDVS